jgi:pilus assembly protein CpaC
MISMNRTLKAPQNTQTPQRLMATLCALAILQPHLVMAQGVGAPRGAAPILNVGPNEQSVARRIDLSIGKSIIVDLPRDAKEVFVANPKVANAVVRSTRKVFVIGMENGATSMFVMDTEGRQIATLDINVGRDLNVLRQTLHSSLPGAVIDVKPAGDSILLSGTVNSALESQRALDIANAFVGSSGGLFTSSKGAVINSLIVKGKDQVMLRVVVAEVARSVLKQLGINTSGAWSAANFANANPFPLAAQALASGNSISGSISRGNFDVSGSLQAFERAGVSRILAEPTLTAISGESARFTAGGEVPIPKSEDCSGSGITRSCSIGIEYKPYGINLSFSPVVLSENRISLRVSTEVTELDAENQIRVSGIGVPGIKVRKSDTTVELPSGASMMTAGLLQQNMGHAINGLPGLMNLPVLGALFRSRDYQRRETELMIIVTPYIAKPMEPHQVAKPTDGFVEPHDAQAILLGRLNKIYGVAGSPPPAYRGRFGFITD